MTKENIDIHKKIDGWTVKEASLKLGISESTMKDWCKKNNIKRQPIVKGRKGAYILSKEDLIKSSIIYGVSFWHDSMGKVLSKY